MVRSDSYRKQCVIDDQVALLEVIDTASQERNSAMREQVLRVGQGFLIVYGIDSRNTFTEVTSTHKEILRIKDRESFPVVIVGNKLDSQSESDRVITEQQGMDLAQTLGCKFIETTVRERINVDEAFFELVREIRRFEALSQRPDASSRNPCMLL